MIEAGNTLNIDVRRVGKKFLVTFPGHTRYKELDHKYTIGKFLELMFSPGLTEKFSLIIIHLFYDNQQMVDDGEESRPIGENTDTAQFVPIEVRPDGRSYVFNVPNLDRELTPNVANSVLWNLGEDQTLDDLHTRVINSGSRLNPNAVGAEIRRRKDTEKKKVPA